MSRIAEIIVVARGAEQVMAPLTRPDVNREWHQCFMPIDDSMFAGVGQRSLECYLWVIQFYRHNWGSLIRVLETLPWPDPYSVQVLVHDEEDDCFGLWMMYDGRLIEVPIPHTRRQPFWESVTGVLSRTDRQQ